MPLRCGTPKRLGVGDVVLVSADGFVLEGPRSSVVIVAGDGALATPPTHAADPGRHHGRGGVRRRPPTWLDV